MASIRRNRRKRIIPKIEACTARRTVIIGQVIVANGGMLIVGHGASC